MPKLIFIFWVRILLLMFFIDTFAQTQSNISYGSDPLQKLDYFKAANPNSPIIFVVHGGGWWTGDKVGTPYQNTAQLFNNEGYAVVNINYRLTPSVTYPAHIEDMACALAWAKNNATTLNGDSGKIALYGHSAGGHIAAYLGVRPINAMLSGCSVTAGLNVDGIMITSATVNFDLTNPNNWQPIKNMLGDSSLYWSVAQPVNHCVNSFDAKFLIICGDLDDLWIGQDSAFHDSLTTYNHCSVLKMFPGNDHNSLIDNLSATDVVFKTMLNFLDSLWNGNSCSTTGIFSATKINEQINLIVYPGLHSGSMVIQYELPSKSFVNLSIYDTNSKLVKKLIEESQSKGKHSVYWETIDNHNNIVASGIYFCILQFDENVVSQKLAVFKQ